MLVLQCLALGLLVYWGYLLLALALVPIAALALRAEWPQPWRGCELAFADDVWTWRVRGGSQSVRIRRARLTLPLLTSLELEALDSRRRWRLNLFHDSVPESALRALRRLIRVQG